MVIFDSIRNSFRSTLGPDRVPPDMDALRALCTALLSDVPASDRRFLLQRMGTLRRADDVWHLRSAVFDVIARTHGETVARARLVKLDELLR